MLLPDNIRPEHTIFFNSAFVLKAIQESTEKLSFLDLYIATQRFREISMPLFVLCLDWLYLLNIVVLDSFGLVELCS